MLGQKWVGKEFQEEGITQAKLRSRTMESCFRKQHGIQMDWKLELREGPERRRDLRDGQ